MRNSITRIAQEYFSHKELDRKTISDKLEMIKNKVGYDAWEKQMDSFKYGIAMKYGYGILLKTLYELLNFESRYLQVFGEISNEIRFFTV